MQPEILFQLVNPLVFLIFATGFITIYSIDRSQHAAAILAITYALGATAFAVDVFDHLIPPLVSIVVTNFFYAATSAAFAVALAVRYGKKPRWLALASLTVIAVSASAWLYLNYGANSWARVALSHACGFVAYLIALSCVPFPGRRNADRLLFIVIAIAAAQMAIRPALMWAFAHETLNLATYATSTFYIVFQFTVGACASLTAMTLLISLSTDTLSELRNRSITDMLSGVLNRSGFEDRTQRFLSDFMEEGGTASIIIVDIDKFKAINDEHGHAFGDLVIGAMGALLSAYATGDRAAGRIGGEEFALFLPNTRLDETLNYAEAIRRKFESRRFRQRDADLSFTASFGVAEYRAGDSVNTLMARADAALYASKAKGRNCVTGENYEDLNDPEVAIAALERRHGRPQGAC